MLHTNRSGKQTVYQVHTQLAKIPGGTSILGGRGVLPPNFASEIVVGATNFALWISDMTPKLGPFPNFCVLWWQNFPKFFHLFGELGRTLPQILPPNLMWGRSPPPRPTSLFGSTPWGKILTYELSGYRFKHQETNWIFLNTQNLKHLDLAEYSQNQDYENIGFARYSDLYKIFHKISTTEMT